MDLREQLQGITGMSDIRHITDYIGNDTQRFDQLMDFFLGDNSRTTQHASHVVSKVFDNYPYLIDVYIERMVSNLDNDVSDAVKRNTLRVLQDKSIPEDSEGPLANKCFDYLLAAKVPVAIKVFAMTILANLTKKYPDFKNELKPIVEELMENGSGGIISRGKRVLKILDKIN